MPIKKWTIIRFPLARSLHPAQGGSVYQGRGCRSQLLSEELTYVEMTLGSVLLFHIPGQTLGISTAQYELHKLLQQLVMPRDF